VSLRPLGVCGPCGMCRPWRFGASACGDCRRFRMREIRLSPRSSVSQSPIVVRAASADEDRPNNGNRSRAGRGRVHFFGRNALFLEKGDGRKHGPVPLPAEGDSPIFAAKRCCPGDKAFPAAKIGTVPRERLPIQVVFGRESAFGSPSNPFRQFRGMETEEPSRRDVE